MNSKQPDHLGWLLLRLVCGLAASIPALYLIATPHLNMWARIAGCVVLAIGVFAQMLIPA